MLPVIHPRIQVKNKFNLDKYRNHWSSLHFLTGTHTRIEHHCGRPLQRCICSKHTGGKIKEWEFKKLTKLLQISETWTIFINVQFEENFFRFCKQIKIWFFFEYGFSLLCKKVLKMGLRLFAKKSCNRVFSHLEKIS